MLNTSLGFSLIMSIIISGIIYVVTNNKKKNEEKEKEKLNDIIILFVISFIVILFGKLCISEPTTISTSAIKVSDVKGGQCPF